MLSPFIMEAKQFLVSPPLKFRLDRVPIDVFKTNCSENDAVRYFEITCSALTQAAVAAKSLTSLLSPSASI